MPTVSLPLLRRTTCPHCWTAFAPDDVLFISAHADLLGDPRLGPEQQQRFLPTRFNIDGNAVDGKGFVCQSLACPKCHLPLPRALLETEAFFVSILGTPACGKSYFLTAMTWELRRVLAQQFALSFTDADTVINRTLNEYEELLFLNSRANELVPLADLIRKTELQGELYDSVMYGNQVVAYPRPYMFAVRPLENHPRHNLEKRGARILCLYDNAGEHFQAGQDTTASAVTQHLSQSRLLLYLFDPTQDPRFRKLCQQRGDVAEATFGGRSGRQESVLLEAAARVRRYTGLSQNAKHQRPLIVVLTKFDIWAHLLEDSSKHEPWVRHGDLFALDRERIDARSQAIRALMLRVCPEVVSTAESFAQHVIYIPVSALGKVPEIHPQTQKLAIKTGTIEPIWVTIPLLYGMCRWVAGMVPSIKPKQSRPHKDGNVTRAGKETASFKALKSHAGR